MSTGDTGWWCASPAAAWSDLTPYLDAASPLFVFCLFHLGLCLEDKRLAATSVTRLLKMTERVGLCYGCKGWNVKNSRQTLF